MTQIPFDQLSKQYLEEFLAPLGTVQRNLEIPGEPKFVDVWFTPASVPTESSNDLGLLGKIAKTPCLLEPFRNAPTRQDIRICLLKLLWIQEERRRRNRQERLATESDLPNLWVLAATASQPVIRDFGGQVRSDGLSGVYVLPDALKTAIIAIDQLPQTEETLWLRILGRDDTQRQAIADVLSLPITEPRRSRILQLLATWKITIELSNIIDDERRELIMVLSEAYLEWERTTEQRGSEREARSLIFRLLTRRVGELPEAVRVSIDQLSLTQVEELGEALLDFTDLSDLDVWLAQLR